METEKMSQLSQELLDLCDLLTYQKRMQHMVNVGRRLLLAAQGATLDDVLSVREIILGLLRGSFYEKMLGLQTCFGSREVGPALDALADSSSGFVHKRALRVVGFLGSDEEAIQALACITACDPGVVISFVRLLRRRHRYAVIDGYVEELAAREDVRLKKLLPYASEEVVRRLLVPRWIERFDLLEWRRLGRFYPRIAHVNLQAWTSTAALSGMLDQQLLNVVNALLPDLIDTEPDLALDLVTRMLTLVSWNRLEHLHKLVQRRPQEMVELVLEKSQESTISFNSVAHRLRTTQLIALLNHHPGTINQTCFVKLPPEQRRVVYESCGQGFRNQEAILWHGLVAALPTEQRIAEARRHLKLSVLQTQPSVRLYYVALLPWDEALPILEPFLCSNEADVRSTALQCVITATRYQSAHLDDMLQLALQRRHEQDPVRGEILNALAALPPSRWRENQLPSLERLIRDSLDTLDLSFMSLHSLTVLLLRLLPFHPTWAAAQVALIYRERGQDVIQHQAIKVPSVVAGRHLAEALSPLVNIWRRSDNLSLLVGLAVAFDWQLPVFPDLLNAMEDILLEELSSELMLNAESILNAISKYARERLDTLVPLLLDRERKFFSLLETVRRYLHRHRQDLLTSFLVPQQVDKEEGKKRKEKRFLSLVYSGFHRWTVTQQELFAQTLVEEASADGTPVPEVLHILNQLAAMCFLRADYVIPFASDHRVPVRDKALYALGKIDAGQGIPTLLSAVDDGSRERVAIYALRPVLKRMPQREALEILQRKFSTTTSVTVAKEVIRLIGGMASDNEDAYQFLVETERRATTSKAIHRDVHIALLQAVCSGSYLECEESWQMLKRVTHNPDSAIALSVLHVSSLGLSATAQRHLRDLLLLLLDRQEPLVRLHVLNRCVQSPINDPQHILGERLVKLMIQSPLHDESSAATRAVVSNYAASQPELIRTAFSGLLIACRENRRNLSTAVDLFLEEAIFDRKRLAPATRLVLAVLAPDPLMLSFRLKLILSALPWSKDTLDLLLALCPYLHADALVSVEGLIELMGSRPDVGLTELELVLAEGQDERLRRLGLSALKARVSQSVGGGWTGELRGCLDRYRRDESVLVAEAAWSVFVECADIIE